MNKSNKVNNASEQPTRVLNGDESPKVEIDKTGTPQPVDTVKDFKREADENTDEAQKNQNRQ